MEVRRVDATQFSLSVLTASIESQAKKAPEKEETAKNNSITRKSLKLTGYLGIGIVRWFIYTTSILIPLAFTIPGNKTVNLAVRSSEMLSKKDNSEAEKDYRSKFNADRFFENFPGFNRIMDVALKSGVNTRTLDKNDGIILNSEDEIQELISQLESKNKSKNPDIEEALILLKDYKEINRFTFGENGPDLKQVCSDKSRLNWQMKTILRSKIHEVTSEDTQRLKEMIRITEYNLDKNNFYINYKIMFDHNSPIESLYIPYKKLDLPKDFNQSQSSEPLIISIANYTFDTFANENPKLAANCMPKTPLTVQASDFSNHILVNTWALTDNDLENILTKSNEKLIPVARFQRTNDMIDLVSNISSTNGTGNLGSSNIYLVKSYDANSKTVTVIGAYNNVHTYKLEDFRKEVPVIILEEKDLSLFNLITFLVFGGTLTASYLTYKGANGLNRLINPNYKSWTEHLLGF